MRTDPQRLPAMADHRSAASTSARTPERSPRSTGAIAPCPAPQDARRPDRGEPPAPVGSPRKCRAKQPDTRTRARQRQTVLDAAGDLLVTRGLVALTTRSVAARAGISEKTVRRWWPSEEALALDALRHEWTALVGHVRRRAHGIGL
jgi:hypothetical protein